MQSTELDKVLQMQGYRPFREAIGELLDRHLPRYRLAHERPREVSELVEVHAGMYHGHISIAEGRERLRKLRDTLRATASKAAVSAPVPEPTRPTEPGTKAAVAPLTRARPKQPDAELSADGIVRTEADHREAVARLRALQGEPLPELPDPDPAPSADGIVRTEADHQAAVARLKALQELACNLPPPARV